MSVNKPRTEESNTPDLQNVNLADVDKLAPEIKHELRELLRLDPLVDSQRVVLLFQYALYERVLLNDDFMNMVLTADFRAGIEDILKIFRTLNACRDKETRRENVYDRAETMTAFLINAIHLAKEGLRDTRYVGMDVYKGLNETVGEIEKILHPVKKKSG